MVDKQSVKLKRYKFITKIFAFVVLLSVCLFGVYFYASYRDSSEKSLDGNKIAKVRFPVETLDLRNTFWEYNEFSGTVINNGDKDIYNITIKLSVSKNRNQWIPEEQFLTIPYKINSGEKLEFIETVNSSGGNPWWSSYLTNAEYYNGEIIPTASPVIKKSATSQQILDTTEWGIAKQIDEVTWIMKVGQDDRIGTPQEIFDALNIYREKNGKSRLTWDNNLADFASTRAAQLNAIKYTDKHAGFLEYTKDVENLRKLGFWGAGENCNYGQRLLGVHLIEWIYAGDEPHDKNQLDPTWTHVGVGVSGLGVSIIFGKWKI